MLVCCCDNFLPLPVNPVTLEAPLSWVQPVVELAFSSTSSTIVLERRCLIPPNPPRLHLLKCVWLC
jgi:hypothetical protein